MGATLMNILEGDAQAQAVCGVDTRTPENCKAPVYRAFEDVKESVDVIIDFSSPAALEGEMQWAVKKGVPAVLASTGYSAEQNAYIDDCAKKIAVFKTANFSLGVSLLIKLVREAACALGEKFDIEIIEKHHSLKADAPSGTALMLADGANKAFGGKKPYVYGRCGNVGRRGDEIGLHAVRGGTIVGEHEVIFAGEDETVTLSHSATSKRVFAAGAVKAAKWLADKPAGKYDMTNLLENI